ncbi:MAG: Ig-like domain-containing protein [Lachnospiraceae bacterium]|nr:Ig-like domain-containing protein [Lachnospiraceae bacterium]
MSGEGIRQNRKMIGILVCVLTIVILILIPKDFSAAPKVAARAETQEDSKETALNEAKLSIKAGETANLFVKGLQAGDKVSFKSSKKKVAKVAATGIVTAVKKGSTKITATVKHADGTSDIYKCTVKVSKAKAESEPDYKDIDNKEDFAAAILSGEDGAYRLKSGFKISESFPVTSDLVIDLNGNTFMGSTKNGMFQIVEGGSLTILDSSKKKESYVYNRGDGSIVDCLEGGALVLDTGTLMADGECVIYSKGDLTINNAMISGGSVCNVYVSDGSAVINGGNFEGSKRAVAQEDGEIVINNASMKASQSCLYKMGGEMVVCGGKFEVYEKKANIAALQGGSLMFNGGTAEFGEVGFIIEQGQLFVNGGDIYSEDKSYAIYAEETKGNAQITVNGGNVKAGYAAMFLKKVSEGGAFINGGTLESTGPVAVSAVGCPLCITGGKIKCDDTVLSVNGQEDQKIKLTGGTFTGNVCLAVLGSTNISIKGGTFKSSDGYGLIISSDFEGKIDYDKSLFNKVLDQRESGESKTDTNESGVRRVNVKYKEGMRIKDVDTLYSVFCLACEQLINPLVFETTDELYAVLKANSDSWRERYEGYYETSSYAVKASYYPGDVYKNFTIEWEFGKEHQINSISADESVYDKADKDVRKYSDMVDDILDSIIKKKMTDEEKIVAVHDYMCENYEYADPIVQTGENSDHTFHAMLDDGTGVCQAYASLFHVMMLKLGIEDRLVTGESTSTPWGAEREAHMWNKVKIDDEWLYVDVTWDDGGADTKYLLKSEKDFYSDGTHFPDA